MIVTGDLCPICNKKQLPPWAGSENARCCQSCGYIEERKKDDTSVNH